MDVIELPIVWRAAVAAKDFAVGEEILRESPLMLLPKIRKDTPVFDKLEDIARRNHIAEPVLYPAVYWTKASDEVKSKVKEFFVPPVPEDSVQYQRYSAACAEIHAMEEFSHIPAKEMMDFLLILRVNAHMIGDGTKTSALFYMGSKVTHSCEPNCMALAIGYNLVYRAIRPLKKGDPITFSYISGWDLWKSTTARQDILRTQRFFDCCCPRCIGPDISRMMICPMCQGHRMLRWEPGQLSYIGRDPNPPTDLPWVCPDCKHRCKDDAMPLEAESMLHDNILTTFFTPKKEDALLPKEYPLAVLQEAETKLGKNHWLAVLMLYTLMALHHGNLNKKQKPWSTGQDVVEWTKRLFEWLELAMPNTMQQAVIAKFCGQTAEVYGLNKLGATWMVQAIPILRVHHGNNGSDIAELVQFVEEHGTEEEKAMAKREVACPDTAPRVREVIKYVTKYVSAPEDTAPTAPESQDPAVLKKMQKREKVKARRKGQRA